MNSKKSGDKPSSNPAAAAGEEHKRYSTTPQSGSRSDKELDVNTTTPAFASPLPALGQPAGPTFNKGMWSRYVDYEGNLLPQFAQPEGPTSPLPALGQPAGPTSNTGISSKYLDYQGNPLPQCTQPEGPTSRFGLHDGYIQPDPQRNLLPKFTPHTGSTSNSKVPYEYGRINYKPLAPKFAQPASSTYPRYGVYDVIIKPRLPSLFGDQGPTASKPIWSIASGSESQHGTETRRKSGGSKMDGTRSRSTPVGFGTIGSNRWAKGVVTKRARKTMTPEEIEKDKSEKVQVANRRRSVRRYQKMRQEQESRPKEQRGAEKRLVAGEEGVNELQLHSSMVNLWTPINWESRNVENTETITGVRETGFKAPSTKIWSTNGEEAEEEETLMRIRRNQAYAARGAKASETLRRKKAEHPEEFREDYIRRGLKISRTAGANKAAKKAARNKRDTDTRRRSSADWRRVIF